MRANSSAASIFSSNTRSNWSVEPMTSFRGWLVSLVIGGGPSQGCVEFFHSLRVTQHKGEFYQSTKSLVTLADFEAFRGLQVVRRRKFITACEHCKQSQGLL